MGILRSGGGFAISLKQLVKLGFANSRSFERQATITQMQMLVAVFCPPTKTQKSKI